MNLVHFCPTCHNLLDHTCSQFADGTLLRHCELCRWSKTLEPAEYEHTRIQLFHSTPGTVTPWNAATNTSLFITSNPYLVLDPTLPVETQFCPECRQSRQCIKVMIDRARMLFQFQCLSCRCALPPPSTPPAESSK